jgi:hypothetical protein
MQGPYKAGTVSIITSLAGPAWEQNKLVRGARYRVTKSFLDADGDEHNVGEEWTFVGSSFSKFDDELAFCVRREGEQEWKIPLIWSDAKQGAVIERWREYFSRA